MHSTISGTFFEVKSERKDVFLFFKSTYRLNKSTQKKRDEASDVSGGRRRGKVKKKLFFHCSFGILSGRTPS